MGIYDFTSPYDRRLLMMRVLEGVNARTDMAENVDQVVGLGGRALIILRYASGLKLRKGKNGQLHVLICQSYGRQKQIVSV